MIDTKELRRLALDGNLDAMQAIIIRLEAAEKERDELRALVVMRFDHDYPPQFTQGYDLHDLTDPVTAEHCRWFVAEIERLRSDYDALRAQIETMEKQEPAGTLHDDGYFVWRKTAPHQSNYAGWKMALYALPGAKGE